MNKLSFKKVFSKAFVVSLAAIAVTNVNALNIREEIATEDGSNDGTYVMGISKFTPGTRVGGYDISKATANEIAYNIDLLGQDPSPIYLYDYSTWYVLGDSNKFDEVTDEKVIASLNSKDIFYVNSVEKQVTIVYNAPDVAAGNKLVFETGKANKTVTYDAATKTLTIPATVSTVTVKEVNATTNAVVSTKDTINKTTPNSNGEFNFTNTTLSTGMIIADGVVTDEKNVTLNGDTITVGGEIAWVSSKNAHDTSTNGSKAGYRVGIKIAAPSGTAVADLYGLKVTLKDSEGNKTEYTWNDSSTDDQYRFWVTPIVENGKTYTLTVVWNETTEIIQEFTLKVNGTLQELPAGKLAGVTQYVKDEDGKDTTETKLTASANSNNTLITFRGSSIAWDGEAVVVVTPDAKYADKNLYSVASTVSAYTLVKDEDYDPKDPYTTLTEFKKHYQSVIASVNEDGDIEIPVTFTEETKDSKGRTVTVTVKWPDGYDQTFDVVLDSSVKFEFPEVEMSEVVTSARNYTFDEKTNTATVTGTVIWNAVKGGNYVSMTATAPTSYGDELENLSIYVNDKKLYTDSENEVPVSFNSGTGKCDISLAIEADNTYSIKVMWNDAIVVSQYTLVIDSKDILGPNPSSLTADNANYTVRSTNGQYVVSVTSNNLIPYSYDLGTNAVDVELENESYPATAKATVKVSGIGNAYEQEVVNGGTFEVKVKIGSTAKVTVDWGNGRTPEVFEVTANSNLRTADMASIETSGIELSTLEANGSAAATAFVEDVYEEKDENNNVTQAAQENDYSFVNNKVTFHKDTATLNWAQANSAIKMYDNSVAGYRLHLEITPDSSLSDYVSEDATMTITTSDGTYTAQKLISLTKGTVENLSTKAVTKTDMVYYSTGKISVDPLVTANTKTMVIKINWTEAYTETITIDLTNTIRAEVAAGKIALNGGTATAETELSYSDVLQYSADKEAGVFELPVVVTGDTVESSPQAATKIEVEDALGYTKYTESLDKSKKVYFTNSSRTATVTVTWANGKVQVFNINASNAKLIEAVLSNTLDKYTEGENAGKFIVDGEGNYSITVAKGSEFSVITGVTVNDGYIIDYDLEESDDEETVANKLVVSTGTNKFKAQNIGVETITATIKTKNGSGFSEVTQAKKVNVIVTIVPATEMVIDAKLIETDASLGMYKLSVKVDGFVSETGNTVKVTPYVLNEETGVYVGASLTGADGETSMILDTNDGSYYLVMSGLDSEKTYKFAIVAKDNTYGTTGYNDALNNALTKSLDLETSVVRYSVTFDSNGSSDSYSSLSVKPGDTIEGTLGETLTAPRKEYVDADGVKHGYKFLGWYDASTAFNADGTLKAGSAAFDLAAGKVTKNLNLKAAWSTDKYDYKLVSVTSNVTMTYNETDDVYEVTGNLPYLAYQENSEGTRYAGNYANFILTAPEELDFENVTVETVRALGDSDVVAWNELPCPEYEEQDHIINWWGRFTAKGQEAKIIIHWGNGNDETITIRIAEGAMLEEA